MSMHQLLLCLMLIISSSLAGAEVYQWVDAEGNTHYGDMPPPPAEDAQSVQKLPIRSGGLSTIDSGLREGEKAMLQQIDQRLEREAAEREAARQRAAERRAQQEITVNIEQDIDTRNTHYVPPYYWRPRPPDRPRPEHRPERLPGIPGSSINPPTARPR